MELDNIPFHKLIDMALIEPEIGAVNFNVLHSFLLGLVEIFGVTDLTLAEVPDAKAAFIRASCQTEGPVKKEETAEESTAGETKVPSEIALEEKTTDVQPTVEATAQKESDTQVEQVEKSDKEGPAKEETDKEKPKKLKDRAPPKPEISEIKHLDAPGYEKIRMTYKKKKHPGKEKDVISEMWTATRVNSRINGCEKGIANLHTLLDQIVDEMDNHAEMIAQVMEEIAAIKAQLENKVNRDEISHLLAIPLDFWDKLLSMVDQLSKIDFDSLRELLSRGVDLANIEEKLREVLKEVCALQNEVNEMQVEKADKGDIKMLMDELDLKADKIETDERINELFVAKEALLQDIKDIREVLETKLNKEEFETVITPIRNRIRALMIHVKKIKEILKKSIYPEASGITKCISCGRAAELTGGEYRKSNASQSDPSKPKVDSSENGSQGSDKKSGNDADHYWREDEIPKIPVNIPHGAKPLMDGKDKNRGLEKISPSKSETFSSPKISNLTGKQSFLKNHPPPKTRFCGEKHTLTHPEKAIYDQHVLVEMPPMEEINLLGFDSIIYRGIKKKKRVDELSDTDKNVDVEPVADDNYMDFPDPPPRLYKPPRYCGGPHTITAPLQKGLEYTDVKLSGDSKREEAMLIGHDHEVYIGTPGTEYDARSDPRLVKVLLASKNLTDTSDPTQIEVPDEIEPYVSSGFSVSPLTAPKKPQKQRRKIFASPVVPEKKEKPVLKSSAISLSLEPYDINAESTIKIFEDSVKIPAGDIKQLIPKAGRKHIYMPAWWDSSLKKKD